MNIRYELPVVQVACMESFQDVEWLWNTVRKGELFDRIILDYPATKYAISVDMMRLVPGKGLDLNNQVQVVGNGKQYILWNQSRKAYLLSGYDFFTEDMVPEALQKNVLVRKKQ